MRPKLALTIGAIAAVLFGLMLLLLPRQMLGGFGLGTPTEGVVLSRDVGSVLLGLGVINWMARDATGAALRGLLVGNLFVQLLQLVVNAWEIYGSHDLPAAAAPGLGIHVVLGLVFALGLARPDKAV
jgi:hypothetical protein